jgi:hypothetical protein
MGAFFESALLFSLAVLIILIGLLIYYFKGRVNDLEQKSMKCLELVGDVYKSHLELKQTVFNGASVVSTKPSIEHLSRSVERPDVQRLLEHMDQSSNPRIQVHLEELQDEDDSEEEEEEEEESSDDDDDDSDDDESDESDSDNEVPPQIKMVNIDFSESLEAEEIDIDVDEEEIIEITETDPIIVSKIDIDGNSESQPLNDNVPNADRESYKKMALPALRGFIISRGYQTDSAKLQKMKKNELIDLIMESQK